MVLVAQVFVVSLLGSMHCAGMCGPLALFALGDAKRRSWRSRAEAQLAYHGGRLVLYSVIGALCGLLGSALDAGATRLGWYRVAALAAGSLMIAVGVLGALRYAGYRLPQTRLPRFISGVLVAGQRAAVGLSPTPRALCVGLLTAFLPCGWLYMFALVAAGAGSPIRGATVMAVFWIGTVPILASLGVGFQSLTSAVGKRLPLVTAATVVVLGVSMIVARMRTPLEGLSGLRVAAGDSLCQVESAKETVPPCCRKAGPPNP